MGNEEFAQIEKRLELMKHNTGQEVLNMFNDANAAAPGQRSGFETTGDVAFNWQEEEEGAPLVQRSITVAVIGTPNTGKSMLMNAVTNSHISAVSPKINTTRENVLGMRTDGEVQIVFIDTPGVNHQSLKKSNVSALSKHAWDAANEADIGLVLIDASKPFGKGQKDLIKRAVAMHDRIHTRGRPFELWLGINKMDLLKPRSLAVELVDECFALHDFTETFYLSCLKRDQIQDLVECFHFNAQVRDWEYKADQTSDMTVEERVHEIIREKIYLRLNKELPYLISQETVSLKDDGENMTIHQRLYVNTSHQQGILIGTQGSVIGSIAEQAAETLGPVVNRKVTISCAVSVAKS